MRSTIVLGPMAENGLTLLQDLVGLPEFTVLTLQGARQWARTSGAFTGSLRALSSLVGPDSSPASRAARRHQSRRLKDEQPSFEAIAR